MKRQFGYFDFKSFTKEEKKIAVSFIAEAIRGFVDVTAEMQAENVFNQYKKLGTKFHKDDEFKIHFEITTIGNDILAAIGAARRKIKKGEK